MRSFAFTFFILMFSIYSSNAQKKFFRSISVNAYIYPDDISYSKNAWQKQFKPSHPPSASNFDSLEYASFGKEWFQLNFNGGWGFQTHLQKIVPVFGVQSRSTLKWNTGFGFRTFKSRNSDPLSYPLYVVNYDTTKIYFQESEQFQLRQHFIDLYNSVVYNCYSKLIPEMYGYIGLGYQISFSINSKIKETYSSNEIKWNSFQRSWEKINVVKDTNFIPAKNCSAFTWTIPVGLGFNLSRKISIEGGIEYFHAIHSPSFTEKKFSEGAMFQFIIRYKL